MLNTYQRTSKEVGLLINGLGSSAYSSENLLLRSLVLDSKLYSGLYLGFTFFILFLSCENRQKHVLFTPILISTSAKSTVVKISRPLVMFGKNLNICEWFG
jgi:hypothetical protein